MKLDFTFEETPWQLFSRRLKQGDTVSALRLLTLLEDEDEEGVEEAFAALQEMDILLDISDLPPQQPSGELGKRLDWEKKLCQSGGLPTGLEENDPLRLYPEELAATPACGDVDVLSMELAEDLSASRREAVQQMLLNLCLSRVVAIAKEYAGNRVLLIDLIQEGSMGAWQVIMSYSGGDFEALAQRAIRTGMLRAIALQARQDGVGQKMRTLCDDYRSADKALLTRLGRNPTLEEIAQELGITVEACYQVESLVQSAALLAKARQSSDAKQEAREDEQSVENTAYYQSREQVNEMLEGLNETQARLISLRFGLEGGLPLSAQEVGKQLNLTPEEVVSMEAEALAQIRKKV